MTSTPARETLGFSTLGFIHDYPLEETLKHIARAGYQAVEIPPVPPHLQAATVTDAEISALRTLLDDLGLACVSVNPIDFNLSSPNSEIRDLAVRNYRAGIRLAHGLGAAFVNVVPGRQSPLRPPPEQQSVGLLLEQLNVLLDDAHQAGVALVMETAPFGFIESTQAVTQIAAQVRDPGFGVALDCANVYYIGEDPAAAVPVAGEYLKMVHLSDSTRARWAHDPVGAGEIDFSAFHAALAAAGYAGPYIYEPVDRADPAPRIADDLRELRARGWQV